MTKQHLSPWDSSSQGVSETSTMVPSRKASADGRREEQDITDIPRMARLNTTPFEKDCREKSAATYAEMSPPSKKPFKALVRDWFSRNGKLRPFRLLKQDVRSIRQRYVSDWTTFNQLVFASAVYVFFTNILPGITFASDLYVLTGMTWGTIEVVFSTGLCGVIFSLFSVQPLTILGVTGPFSVLAENIYDLCQSSFNVSPPASETCNANCVGRFLTAHGMVPHTCWMDALAARYIQCP